MNNQSRKLNAQWRVTVTVKMTAAASVLSLNRFMMIHKVYAAGIGDIPPRLAKDAMARLITREDVENIVSLQEDKVSIFARGVADMIDGGWIDEAGIRAAVAEAEKINRFHRERIKSDPTAHTDCMNWVASALRQASSPDGHDNAIKVLASAITALNSAVAIDIALALPGGIVISMNMDDGILRANERAISELVKQGAPASAIQKAREHMAGVAGDSAIFN